MCAGRNAAGREQRWEGAPPKAPRGAAAACGDGQPALAGSSVLLDVPVGDLENVPGLIPRQKLCASEAETERSEKKYSS